MRRRFRALKGLASTERSGSCIHSCLSSLYATAKMPSASPLTPHVATVAEVNKMSLVLTLSKSDATRTLASVDSGLSLHSPSTGDTRPSAVRTKCVILVFLAFLFWLPTSISILAVPCESGHIMARGLQSLAFDAASGWLGSLCVTAAHRRFRIQLNNTETWNFADYIKSK